MDYFLPLRERVSKVSNQNLLKPKKGDVVLVDETNLPQSLSKLAIICEEIDPSKVVRFVSIRFSFKHVTKRAVDYLYSLETAFE